MKTAKKAKSLAKERSLRKKKKTLNIVVMHFSWTSVLLRFNKNCKQPQFKCVLLLTSHSLQPFVYTGCYMKFIIPNKLVSLI